MAEDEGFDLIMVWPPSSWRQAALIRAAFRLVRTPPESDGKKEKPHQMVWLSFWQRMRDSNPRKRSQSPVCYRYTNPLCCEQHGYYTANSQNVKNFFSFIQNIFVFCPVPTTTLDPHVPNVYNITIPYSWGWRFGSF